ncbi:MAG: glycosyltransferase family 4 protein [Rhodospirillales bacterium]|nr:glycosyltransferase family 4 protein [Rhodospirillales bacterium]
MSEISDINTDATSEERQLNEGTSYPPLDPERSATVLQVLPALNTGGVERSTVEVAEAIVEANGRAIVVSAGGSMVYELARVGAEHIEMPTHSKNPFVMYKNIGRLVEIIKKYRVDVVHVRSRAPAWSSYFAAKRTGKPLVITFHGTYSVGNFLKRKYNSIMTSGDRIIANSRFIAGHMRRIYGVPVNKIRVIHRGVDLQRFNPKAVSAERVVALANEWRLDDGYPVIMLPGRLTRWKGQTVFIDAIKKLNRRDVRCLLVGDAQGRDDYRKELENLVESHDLGEIVRIVDHCDDMPAAYMLTDIVVSASTDPEAFGRVVIEAQSLGRPVIATAHGGAQETVIENETGWLVTPGDAEALAKTIEKALNLTAEERAVLAEKGIANIRNNFSKDAMCTKTLEVYNEVLTPAKAP